MLRGLVLPIALLLVAACSLQPDYTATVAASSDTSDLQGTLQGTYSNNTSTSCSSPVVSITVREPSATSRGSLVLDRAVGPRSTRHWKFPPALFSNPAGFPPDTTFAATASCSPPPQKDYWGQADVTE